MLLAVTVLGSTGCRNKPMDEMTSVTVKEVEQVGMYTYLLVKGKGPEYWVAVPSMDASPGERYEYQGGMMMKDFYSKELDRSFDEVLFLEAIFPEGGTAGMPGEDVTPGSKVAVQKKDVIVEPAGGSVAISELFKDPESFEGKTIRIRGEVTRYNPDIMGRNWIHLQDGTEYKGKFDLAATSDKTFKMGSVVTLEGILAINKDFGYGYYYELLLEQATEVE